MGVLVGEVEVDVEVLLDGERQLSHTRSGLPRLVRSECPADLSDQIRIHVRGKLAVARQLKHNKLVIITIVKNAEPSRRNIATLDTSFE